MFQSIASAQPLGVPIVAFYALAVVLIVWYALEHTRSADERMPRGANREAARLAGVRTWRYVLGSLVVAGVMSSLAGVLVAAKVGEVAVARPPYLLPAFAGCFLGTTQLKIGRFNVGAPSSRCSCSPPESRGCSWWVASSG